MRRYGVPISMNAVQRARQASRAAADMLWGGGDDLHG